MSARQIKIMWCLIIIGMAVGAMQTVGLIAWKHAEDRIGRVSDERQRDMCDLLAVAVPSAGPSPTTERGLQVARAAASYRAHNCETSARSSGK